jgi:formyl-CoA transferase
VQRSLTGSEPGRLGNAEPGCCPSGIFPTLDGHWLALVVRDESEFGALVRLAGGSLSPFAALGLDKRIARRDEIEAALSGWTRTLPQEALLSVLRGAGIGAGPYNNYRDAVASQPFAALQAIERLDHPAARKQAYLRVPVRFDGAPVTSRRPAPTFGHDVDEVFTDLCGLSLDELAAFRTEGAIRDVPDGALPAES